MTLPTGIRTPIVLVDVDPQVAESGPSIQQYKVLLIGQRTSGGATAELVRKRLASADAAGQQFGRGSQLHRMAIAYFAANRSTETWFVALDDNGSGVAATQTITVTGTPTEAGPISLYVAGVRLTISITTSDTPTTIAAAIVAAVTADTSLPVTAGNVAGVVTLTAKNAGTIGNAIDVRENFQPGEETPAGIALAIAAGAAGANDPTNLASALALMGDDQFHVLVVGLEDSTSIGAVDTELASRFGPTIKKHGHAFYGTADTFSNLTTKGAALNSKHSTIIGANSSPSSPWEWAASLGGVVAKYGQEDPARPFQTLELPGIVGPAQGDRFTFDEQELLLVDGISTFEVDAQGAVRLQRVITTFQTNEAGAPSTSFLDVNTLLTISYITFDLDARTRQTFPRHKLANDGTQFGAGQAILTPKRYKGFLLALFSDWELLGLVEGRDQFKRDLVVERDAQDPNRLNVTLPPDLVNQARVFGVSFQFLLQAAA